jgi:hypothetical protein
MMERMILNFGKKAMMALILFGLVFTACGSSNKTSGYQPKYKKPNPNKPLPCPLKDC